ncbi:Imm70 family immunity protein [Pseudobutyrivibrio xylanivorans]|uniref:Uncharacterized protein n=1 Tax=Pseudobutyrivibrio xylanivorans TaxID=185007 RepID=A0A5P6VL44_PSEXY|nr:Imm70 family immunity protein [Pseudobutyrivibrio xylanivorans]QFJ53386.1 hypothetical protein FXF36_00110 [Pseudobutyrivibrio xylanivorans]QFJ53463.1 hypothetical protein FXF36_00520 [Pseudobutyrivibrio xylanivorans]
MELFTEDRKRYVDVGGSWILHSVYSTAQVRLGGMKRKIPLAMDFLQTGKCEPNNAIETARQINLLRDEFSKIKPEKAVYDCDNPKVKAPWDGNLSYVTTSCANLYTTADGKDLLFELVSILTYADIMKKAVDMSE